MKLPRDLSGADLVEALCKHYGYRRLHQEGSHIILETNTPSQHRISIPNHNPLRVGTLDAILRAVSRAKRVEKEEILQRL
jgi:predicted RNA binding protein YcfA (HicA-like mRNA interferase family)